jgi:dTDP-4-amino-4,6-dideoxygalactose transaminase
MNKSKLALPGGKKPIQADPKDIFTWPIVNKKMEDEVLKVLRAGNMSGTDVTRRFERGFADWRQMKYGLGCNNGTAALHCAMFGLGVGVGDREVMRSSEL